MGNPTDLGTTVGHVFRVAYQPTTARALDADKCSVSAKLLDSNGDETGSKIEIGPSAATDVDMEQYHPGWFIHDTGTVKNFTRGSSYRATYVITIGGTAQTAITQDFVAQSQVTAEYDTSDYHTYTLKKLRNIARAALGLKVGTSGVDAQEPGSANTLDIVNDALEEVYSAHDWTWRRGDAKHIDFVPGIFKMRLGRTFGKLRVVKKHRDLVHRLVRKPFDDLVRHQEQDLAVPTNVTYYDVVYDPPDGNDQRGEYALYVWPTPSTYLQNALVVHYDRIAPKLCNETDTAPFPDGFFKLVKYAIRAEAFEQEGDERADLERLRYERLLQRMTEEDGRRDQMDLGSMVRGTAIDSWEPEFSTDPEATMTLREE